jgi:hypothetical protein
MSDYRRLSECAGLTLVCRTGQSSSVLCNAHQTNPFLSAPIRNKKGPRWNREPGDTALVYRLLTNARAPTPGRTEAAKKEEAGALRCECHDGLVNLHR